MDYKIKNNIEDNNYELSMPMVMLKFKDDDLQLKNYLFILLYLIYNNKTAHLDTVTDTIEKYEFKNGYRGLFRYLSSLEYIKDDDIFLKAMHRSDEKGFEFYDLTYYTMNIVEIKERFDGLTTLPDVIVVPRICVNKQTYLNDIQSRLNNDENLNTITQEVRGWLNDMLDHEFYRQLFVRYDVSNKDAVFTNEIKKDTDILYIYDKLILKNKLNSFSANETSFDNSSKVVINPNVGKHLGIPTIPIDHLLGIFGVDEDKLYKTMKDISYMTNQFVIVGLGGTMNNFMHFSHELMKYFKMDYLFKKLAVFERDDLDLTNLPRITLDYTNKQITRKDMFDQQKSHRFSQRNKEHSKIGLMSNISDIALGLKLMNEWFSTTNANTFYIGTPNLSTRNLISNAIKGTGRWTSVEKSVFICPMHSNDELLIYKNPSIDDGDLAIETYGSIDINKFLLTMFKMTIELLLMIPEQWQYRENDYERLLLKYKLEDTDFKTNSANCKALKNICYSFN